MNSCGVASSPFAHRPDFTAGEDDDLVAAAQGGQQWAFVELCTRNSGRVFQMIYGVTRNREDAEDALQDAMLRAFRNLKQFDGRSSFATWLTRIGINSALMLLRKKNLQREVSLDATEKGDTWETLEFADRSPNPEQHYADRQRSMQLQQGICDLPQTLRVVVELGQMGGHSMKEIARSAGITLPAAKSRLTRAKTALRKSMI